MNFMPLPQDQTFESAQKLPEVIGDDPCKTALKTRKSGFAFPVHGVRWNLGSPCRKCFKDYCYSWYPAAATQYCSEAVSCYEKNMHSLFSQISIKFPGILNTEISFSSFLLCLSSYIPALSFCCAVYLPNPITLIQQNTTALNSCLKYVQVLYFFHMWHCTEHDNLFLMEAEVKPCHHNLPPHSFLQGLKCWVKEIEGLQGVKCLQCKQIFH